MLVSAILPRFDRTRARKATDWPELLNATNGRIAVGVEELASVFRRNGLARAHFVNCGDTLSVPHNRSATHARYADGAHPSAEGYTALMGCYLQELRRVAWLGA